MGVCVCTTLEAGRNKKPPAISYLTHPLHPEGRDIERRRERMNVHLQRIVICTVKRSDNRILIDPKEVFTVSVIFLRVYNSKLKSDNTEYVLLCKCSSWF